MRLSSLIAVGAVLSAAAVSTQTEAQVVPLPTAQTALVGRFAQGPLDLPLEVGATQFQQIFGSNNLANWPAEVQARQFFAQGGSTLFVVRVTGSGPLDAALVGRASDATGLYALEPLSDLRILIAPELSLLSSDAFTIDFAAVRAFCEPRRIFFILDPPPGLTTATAMINWTNAAVPDPARFCAVYFPYLQVQIDGVALTTTPCGAMAAVYAASDASVGPWNSPAGSSFPLQATGVTPVLNTNDSNALNTASIDAIRQFPGTGIIPWGARSLERSNEASRYIPVVRTEDWVASSIQRALAFTATRDDAEPLWSDIRTLVGDFLHSLYIQGAFQGTTPNQAYFVRCDATTTTAADIAAHRVNVLYGMAFLQPSEFDVTQLSSPTADPLRPTPLPLVRIRTFAGEVYLWYATEPGFNYVLESKTDLAMPDWTDEPAESGDGAWRRVTRAISGNHEFYRVKVTPAQ